jgi:hypothetical protein
VASRRGRKGRVQEGEEATGYMRRVSPGQHIFQSVWAVFLAGPGWSGGWSERRCEPVWLGEEC